MIIHQQNFFYLCVLLNVQSLHLVPFDMSKRHGRRQFLFQSVFFSPVSRSHCRLRRRGGVFCLYNSCQSSALHVSQPFPSPVLPTSLFSPSADNIREGSTVLSALHACYSLFGLMTNCSSGVSANITKLIPHYQSGKDLQRSRYRLPLVYIRAILAVKTGMIKIRIQGGNFLETCTTDIITLLLLSPQYADLSL